MTPYRRLYGAPGFARRDARRAEQAARLALPAGPVLPSFDDESLPSCDFGV